jgi:hypothetical protein
MVNKESKQRIAVTILFDEANQNYFFRRVFDFNVSDLVCSLASRYLIQFLVCEIVVVFFFTPLLIYLCVFTKREERERHTKI